MTRAPCAASPNLLYALEGEGEQISKKAKRKLKQTNEQKITCRKSLKTFTKKELLASFHRLEHALQRCPVSCTALYIPRSGKPPRTRYRRTSLVSYHQARPFLSPITHGLQRLFKHRGASRSLRAPAAALPASRTPR